MPLHQAAGRGETGSKAREAIASHLRHCAQNTTSFFYIINCEKEHPFSLAQLFGLSTFELNSLLVAANLATIVPNSNQLKLQGKEWLLFIGKYELVNVEKIERTRVDILHCLTGVKGSACQYHLLRVGKRMPGISSRKFNDHKDPSTGILDPPPSFAGQSAWKRTLRRITRRARLDAIVNDVALFEEALHSVERPPKKAPALSPRRVHKVIPKKVSPEKCEVTSSSKRQKITHEDNECVSEDDDCPVKDRLLCEILGDNYDVSDNITSSRVDNILFKLTELKRDSPELTFKNQPNRNISYVRVPRTKSQQAFYATECKTLVPKGPQFG